VSKLVLLLLSLWQHLISLASLQISLTTGADATSAATGEREGIIQEHVKGADVAEVLHEPPAESQQDHSQES